MGLKMGFQKVIIGSLDAIIENETYTEIIPMIIKIKII